MLTIILRYLSGYLRIRIEGYSPERFLNLCSHYGIYLWDLKPSGHAYEMNISVSGFRKLKPVIRKTRTKVIIRERTGFPFFLHKYRKRKLFFAGFFLCLLCIQILTLFVWNIHIDGNRYHTDEALLEFLESRNVTHGMRKSEIDCSRIVKDLRKEYDDVIWASAYLKGTRLMIRIKENTDRITKIQEESVPPPADLIADRDGTILRMITRNGVPKVHEGDAVKTGDLLVSGNVEVLNDAKETTGFQYQIADAEIIARTELHYEDSIPVSYIRKNNTGKKSFRFRLELQNKIYFFGSSEPKYKHFTSQTIEKRFRIGEHFWLPFSFGVQTCREYTMQNKKYTKNEYQTRLSYNFRKFCDNLEKKGVQILENNVKIYKENEKVCAKGTLILAEPIGKLRTAEKAVIPDQEKNSPDGEQEGN